MEKFQTFAAGLHRWAPTGFTILGTLLAFVGAYWGSYSGDDETPWKVLGLEIPWQVVGFGVGILGVAMAAWLPIREARATHRQIADLNDQIDKAKVDGREEFLLIVDFVLMPLIKKLGRLSRTAARSQARKTLATEIRGQALHALKEVIDPTIPRLRANYFKLEYSTRTGDPYLVEAGSTANPPRSRFDLMQSGEEADALLHMLAAGEYVFTHNCMTHPPSGFDNTRSRSYETFISAAATDGSDVVGMLTVDSPLAGSLTEADAVLVRLIATIVAIADSIAEGRRD